MSRLKSRVIVVVSFAALPVKNIEFNTITIRKKALNFPLFLFPQTRKQCASSALQGTGGALDRTGVALQRPGFALHRTGGALERTGGAKDRTDVALLRIGVALQRTGGALERTDGAKDRTWLGGFPDFLRFRFLDFMNFGEDQGDSGKCVMKDTFIC